MKLKKLSADFKRCRGLRGEYQIRWAIECLRDHHDTLFYIFPTVIVQPWVYRYPNTYVIDIAWLFWHIGIGLWERKGVKQ